MPQKFHRRGARARGRRQRIFFALKETPQPPGQRFEIEVSPQFEQIGGLAQAWFVKPDRRRGETAPQPMDAPGGAGGRVPSGVGRKMLGVAQRGKILAMARQGGAGGRGAQGQALARRAGERRIEAKKITIDKSGANTAALESYNAEYEADIEIRQIKYLTDVFDKSLSVRFCKNLLLFLSQASSMRVDVRQRSRLSRRIRGFL